VLASGSLTVASGVHSAKSQTSTYTTDLLSAQNISVIGDYPFFRCLTFADW